MNWTGGGLSRSRNAKGSLTAKQKSYFAKARGRVQDRRPSPNKLQFFEFGAWLPERKDDDFSPFHQRQEEPSSVQKTLDQFATTRPIVKRLEGLKERREPRKRKRTPLTETRDEVRPKTPKLQKDEPIVIGSSPSASSASPRDSPAVSHRPPQSSSSEDILNAPSIETQRRRLLEMDDWVGVDRPVANPVKIKFADPADKDLIGKRRRITKVNYRHPSDRKRHVVRAEIPLRRDHHIPKFADSYYPEGDISVRIGSAVDRSDGRASLKNQDRLSVLSDELLDGEHALSVNRPPSSVPVYNTPGPVPVRWPSHGYREVLTPSAFMDDSSSNDRSPKRTIHGQHYSSPAKAAAGFTSNGIDELREWALPSDTLRREHEEPKFRLVFDTLPRPQASNLDERGRSPIVRDSGFSRVQTPKALPQGAAANSALDTSQWKNELQDVGDVREPRAESRRGYAVSRANGRTDVAPPSISMAKEYPVSGNVVNNHTHSDPKIADLTFCTPPSAEKASAQLLTEFNERVASNAKLDGTLTRTLDDLEKRWATVSGKSLPSNAGQAAPRDLQRAEELSYEQSHDTSNEKSFRAYLAEPPPAGSKTLLAQAPPQAPKTQQQPCSPKIDITPSQPTTTSKEAALKTAEDEEAAWRKFVFGDEQEDITAYTFEEPEPSNQAAPSLTQPSLLAEAATSPLKQNPHLADSTFDTSSISPDVFRSPLETYPEISPTKNLTKITATESKQAPTTHSSSPHSSSLSPAPSTPQLPTQRTLLHNPTNSSLLAEGSTTSQIPTSLAALSSDELARSPERLISNFKTQTQTINPDSQRQQPSANHPHEQTSKPQHEKIVFKKPMRYVGSHASDPPGTVVLGERVLRSGRRVGEKGTKGRKGGKSRTREMRGWNGGRGVSDFKDEEEDEIIDD